jgi:transglutaminase-like putative cysteine protease
MRKLYKILLSLSLFSLVGFFFSNRALASEADFIVDTKTDVLYTTGDDFVTVRTEYTRTVENSTYYFPATGEKIFHIPDITGAESSAIEQERKYKLESLSVTDIKGSSVNYSVEQEDPGQGLYITIPNYKATTSTSPYQVVMQYKTRDYVLKTGNFVNIVGTSLPQDTVFEKVDQENGTLTVFNYYYTIIVDNDIPPLAKVFPAHTRTEKDEKTHFEFSQTDRIGNSPYLEFGTSVLYKFELKYETPQTDNLIPEKYSSVFKALSTNIYEISLPREFSETNQRVYFDKVSPLPKDIYKDSEGNILALFEVPANQQSSIEITGYISAEQDEFRKDWDYFDMDYDEYLEIIQESDYVSRYLGSTKYWQTQDDYIRQEAELLKDGQETLLDIVRANYQYINENLEYDQEKATSENTRIGAKEALMGGPSVCMEYADVMISLLRAQGIPSRAAIGYANLREIAPSSGQVRHQWVQIWVPDYGWLSVDPTFESENMKIGQMLDRVLWEVFNDDSLSNIRIYSANNVVDLTTEGFTINIMGAEDSTNVKELDTYTDLIETEEIRDHSSPKIGSLTSTILKTTTLGKALLVTVPILLTLIVLTIVISSVSYVIKNHKRKKKSRKKRKTEF